MLTNYIKVAFRNLLRNRIFSVINIMGLAIGMTACLLLLQFVNFKLSFDLFNENATDLYRVVNDRYQNGKLIQHGTITYSGVSPAMQHDFPEVVNHSRVEPQGPLIVIHNDKKLVKQTGFAVENTFLQMFDYPLVVGNAQTALQKPRSIVLTETLAKKIFGVTADQFDTVLGKTIHLQSDDTPFNITGICKDVPENSHLRFDFLNSYITLYTGENSWHDAEYNFTSSDFWHYIQLKPGTDYKTLEAKLPAFSQRYFQGNKVSGTDETFSLQPLSKAHLYSDFEYEIGRTGNATVVWGLLVIALFIMSIAWVNYINLSTARSVERAKEVGIRKVVGGIKTQLITQFFIESILVNTMAMGIAIVLVFVLQTSFNSLLQTELSWHYLFVKSINGYGIPLGLGLMWVLGVLVSGLYPAFVLSSFKPISILKGKFSHSRKGIAFRRLLVVGQFSITIILITGSIVVFQQIRFMNAKELGFNMDQIVVVSSPSLTSFDSTFINRVNNFKEELKQISQVKGATTSWNVPGGDIGRSFNVHQEGSDSRFTMRHTAVDFDFLKVYGIQLIAGRSFEPTDHDPDGRKLRNILINQSAAKLLGFASPEAAIGKSIVRGERTWEVKGVINDYHQKSLQYPLEPMLFMPFYSTNSDISVKITPNDVPRTLAAIKQKYETFFPGNVFDYTFLDERFNTQYKNEQLFGKAFSLFASVAILVACLGLFGLAMFSTIQRTKEIGIRKVLGASTSGIVALLSRDFLKLVLIAFVIATPVAWYAMNQWLKDFAYKIDLSWWIFALAGILAVLIALLTVSFQAIKAALANPVKSLRSE